jgi:hypothetical protein
MGSAGVVMATGGMIMGAIGAYYGAKTMQYQLKSRALSLDYQKEVSLLNAGLAEREARSTLQAGERRIGQYTMQAGAYNASQAASLAARGIQAGVGSTAETVASAKTIQKIDTLTMNANTVRAAEAYRMQSQQFKNEALFAGVSAENMRAQARSINPWLSAATSLLGGAGSVASQWANEMRAQEYYGQRG